MNKKLQVFVSSTYTDLIEERQAAVQAILDAGHIPAGMELFKAGNESQLKTIYKWIDESDVYMLILGGRYGSIEEESGLSYTELEYKYALSKKIPVFSVVLSESFITKKITSLDFKTIIEQNNPDKYKSFKSLVMSKTIRQVDDCKDIKIAIHTTLNEFMHKYDLIGWIRNTNENDNAQLVKNNALLLKENNNLIKQVNQLQKQVNEKSNQQFGRFSYDELVTTFTNKNFSLPPNLFKKLFKDKNETCINALDFYIHYFPEFANGIINRGLDTSIQGEYICHYIAPFYISFNLLEKININKKSLHKIQSTQLGESFYAMLETKKHINIL